MREQPAANGGRHGGASERGGRRISTLFIAVSVAVTTLTTLLAFTLVFVTSLFHRATDDLAIALDGVRAAEEAAINLLLHDRANDLFVKRSLEEDLRNRLAQLAENVHDGAEARVLRSAQEQATRYFSQSDEDAAGTEALIARNELFRSLQRLVDVNARQARAIEARVARWDVIASVFGAAVALVVVALVAALLVWLRLRAVKPLLGFFDAMRRFGGGDRDARAPVVESPREVRDMALRFNEMAETLAHQREAQFAFLGGVAHDFRNPLTALLAATRTLRDDAPLPPEDRLRQTLSLVRRQVIRLDRMVGDLVDRARVEAADLELRWQVVDARDLVRAVEELYRDASPAHRLELDLPAERMPVSCDPLRIEQVLTNLVSNAIKYSPAGGPVTMHVTTSDDVVVLRVSDRGVGMSAEELARVFEPFHRGPRLSAEVPGAGLGLSVVRRIVDAHGGSVHVSSEPGKGSTFEVRLPRSGA